MTDSLHTLTANDFAAIVLTLKLAATTTGLLLFVGTPLAWWLARTQCRFKSVIHTLVALPLVLPPSVLGFYLLVSLGADGFGGQFTQWLGLGLLPFTFAGLVVGSMIYSLPFVVQPIHTAFASVGDRPFEVAATLRANPLDSFFTVALPLARHGLLNGAALGFAHTVGEFGVVLMLGGNIPGKTQVMSLRIYQHVEAMEYDQAYWLAGGMLLFSFVILLAVNSLAGRTHQ